MANIPADVQKELLRLTDAKNKIIDLIKDCKENGQVENAKTIDLEIDTYDVIALQPDNRIYNRARVKRETERAIGYETDR